LQGGRILDSLCTLLLSHDGLLLLQGKVSPALLQGKVSPAASPVLPLQFLVWFGLYFSGLRYRPLNLMLVVFFFYRLLHSLYRQVHLFDHIKVLCNCVLHIPVVNMLVQTVDFSHVLLLCHFFVTIVFA
jgi:hypothetical protein